MTCHREDGVWWAESSQLPGLSAAAGSLDELRVLAAESARFELGLPAGSPDVELAFRDEGGAALDARSTFIPASVGWLTRMISSSSTAFIGGDSTLFQPQTRVRAFQNGNDLAGAIA